MFVFGSRMRCVHFLSLALSLFHGVLSGEDVVSSLQELWQRCDVFVAPSTTGWGVYAARDFDEREIVSLSALAVPLNDDVGEDFFVRKYVLEDYVFGYADYRPGEEWYVLLYGASMLLNHHPVPNVEYCSIGEGPFSRHGYLATRPIRAGEQLFVTYGIDDQGVHWFENRGMDMMAPEESILSSESLPYFSKEFCSNIYANIGRPFWERLEARGDLAESGVDPPPPNLAPFDAGFGDARAKRPISNGERIEIGSGLLLSTPHIAGTILGGLVFSWQHLREEHRASLRVLRESGQLMLQGQDEDSDWARVDRFVSYEDLSILPSGGNIGMVRRVGETTETSNCHLNILWHLGQRDSVSVTLELRATRDIDTGDVLLLDLPPAGTKDELRLLKDTMDDFGQPYFPGLFDAALDLESKAEL